MRLTLRSLMQRDNLELPISVTQINAFILAWQTKALSSKYVNDFN